MLISIIISLSGMTLGCKALKKDWQSEISRDQLQVWDLPCSEASFFYIQNTLYITYWYSVCNEKSLITWSQFQQLAINQLPEYISSFTVIIISTWYTHTKGWTLHSRKKPQIKVKSQTWSQNPEISDCQSVFNNISLLVYGHVWEPVSI